jgi:RNA polymerase sigma-70 factor (ECF subfamily)
MADVTHPGPSPLASRSPSSQWSVRVKEPMVIDQTSTSSFESFVRETGPRLRLALISAYGPEVGSEATAEALAYGWEHWGRLQEMENPAGYLYRVGQSRSRRFLRRHPKLPPPRPQSEPLVEPGLPGAVAGLSRAQRTCVLLVHGYGWSTRETADVLGLAPSTVQRNSERAIRSLRDQLGVEDVT